MDSFDHNPEILWRPDCNKTTKMNEFRLQVNNVYNLKLETYHDLYQWSINCYQDFWKMFWQFSGLIASSPYTKVTNTEVMTDIPKWFCDSKLNYAENLLKFNDDKIAIIATGEGVDDERITFTQLRKRVAVFASALKKLGIKKGDRVAGYLPNGSLAVEAMLASASLGAIWSSTSPDFGSLGVLDRFVQIDPQVIFSVDAVTYNAKVHNHVNKLKEVVNGLPNLQNVVVFPHVGKKEEIDLKDIPNSMFHDDFLNLADNSEELTFEQVPFDHPLFIMYSSGTTGKPKCLVHSVGGTLIQHLKEHILQGNMTRKDCIIYYTTVINERENDI